jgi:hypothetical protein
MRSMKNGLVIGIILISLTSWATADGFEGRPLIACLSMPTGETLADKELLAGLGPVAFGLTDRLQIGINLLEYVIDYRNGYAKFKLIDSDRSALAVGVEAGDFYVELYGDQDEYVFLSPYIACSYKTGPTTKLHLSARLSDSRNEFFRDLRARDWNEWDAQRGGLFTGTSVNAGFEQSPGDGTKLLLEIGYHFGFERFEMGTGVLRGWKTTRFKLGVKCYGSSRDEEAYIMPVLGLWWRIA